jgi:hypothetical protein
MSLFKPNIRKETVGDRRSREGVEGIFFEDRPKGNFAPKFYREKSWFSEDKLKGDKHV